MRRLYSCSSLWFVCTEKNVKKQNEMTEKFRRAVEKEGEFKKKKKKKDKINGLLLFFLPFSFTQFSWKTCNRLFLLLLFVPSARFLKFSSYRFILKSACHLNFNFQPNLVGKKFLFLVQNLFGSMHNLFALPLLGFLLIF